MLISVNQSNVSFCSTNGQIRENDILNRNTHVSQAPPSTTTPEGNGLPLPPTSQLPPTSIASPLNLDPLAALSSIENNDPETKEKKLTEMISQLQKLRENLRQQQEPQQDKVSTCKFFMCLLGTPLLYLNQITMHF